MLEVLKNFFRTSKPQQEQHFHRPIRARFDAAQTTRDNAKHWAYADQLSADMEASPEVRRTLRTRSRYEVANNSYARGLVQMLANDTYQKAANAELAALNRGERNFPWHRMARKERESEVTEIRHAAASGWRQPQTKTSKRN